MDKQSYFHGTGRRKTATAQVKLMAGNGAIIIDGKPLEERFPSLEHQRVIVQPFMVTESTGKYNVVVKVAGGGVTGQSDAIAHGISRALVRADERFKPVLRQNGLLTRDARAKERKKPGLKRARKAPQYTKR
ncbi:MAG: 30S ribosomal protein S9 [Dehalococcoidales bacterium]